MTTETPDPFAPNEVPDSPRSAEELEAKLKADEDRFTRQNLTALEDIPGIFDGSASAEAAPAPLPDAAAAEGAPQFETPQAESHPPVSEDAFTPTEEPPPVSAEPVADAGNPIPSPDDFPPLPELPVDPMAAAVSDRPEEEGLEAGPEAQSHPEPGAQDTPPETTEPPVSDPMSFSPSDTLQKVKTYAEGVGIAEAALATGYPFSLLITGNLSEHEKARLTGILSRENMGVREVDLEPQFESGRILIPRISEYAGVLIVQALRGTSAAMKLAPADAIFSTEETRNEHSFSSHAESETRASDSDHPAETMTVTPGETLPGTPYYVVIDVVTASAALQVSVVEAESSERFQATLESLTRELKYKAYRRGGSAIIHFSHQLSALSLPSHYRLTVMGSAIKASGPSRPA